MRDWIRLRLEDWDVSIDVRPAVERLNPEYRFAVLTRAQGLHLALSLERVSEESAERVWAEIYADTVVEGIVDLDMPNRDWLVAWLLADPERFLTIRRYAMAEENFGDADARLRSSLGSTG